MVLVCNFCFSNSPSNKANIFLGLIEYELNSLLGASHLVDYISIHVRFDLERYLLNVGQVLTVCLRAKQIIHFRNDTEKKMFELSCTFLRFLFIFYT